MNPLAQPFLAYKSVTTVVFGVAAISKATNMHDLKLSMLSSRLLAFDSIAPAAYTVVGLEAFVAVGFWIPLFSPYAARIGALLSGFFVGYSFWRIYYGIEVPCQCLGPLWKLPPLASAVVAFGLLICCVKIMLAAQQTALLGTTPVAQEVIESHDQVI